MLFTFSLSSLKSLIFSNTALCSPAEGTPVMVLRILPKISIARLYLMSCSLLKSPFSLLADSAVCNSRVSITSEYSHLNSFPDVVLSPLGGAVIVSFSFVVCFTMSRSACLMSLSCRVIMSVSTSFCRMILLPVLPMSTPCAAV